MPRTLQQLTTEGEADAVFERDRAIVYKHSTRCPISSFAYDEVERFVDRHPDAPVYLVDVIANRATSRHIAARTGVTHHSPQVIVLRDGAPVWDRSHDAITAGALERQWELLRD